MQEKIQLFEMTIDIEKAFGRRLQFPESPKVSDVHQLKLAHETLRTGRGKWKQEPKSVLVAPGDIAALAAEAARARAGESRIQIEIFGEMLDFGMARYNVPPMVVGDIQPVGMTPLAPARVQLLPSGSGEFEWELINPLSSGPSDGEQ